MQQVVSRHDRHDGDGLPAKPRLELLLDGREVGVEVNEKRAQAHGAPTKAIVPAAAIKRGRLAVSFRDPESAARD